MPQAKRCMQKVGGQGAAWHWGKERGSGGTPAAIFDKFVRSKDVAGRGQRGRGSEGGNGGRWSAQQRISISFISIILIKLKKYIQGGSGGKQQNNNNKAGRKKAGERKKEKQKQARQIKKRKKRWKIGKWKTQKCAACNEGAPKSPAARHSGTAVQTGVNWAGED